MKKILGILLILGCGFIGLIFVAACFSLFMEDSGNPLAPVSEIIITLLMNSLFIGGSIFGIIKGIQMMKGEKPLETIPFNEPLNITRTQAINEEEVRDVKKNSNS